MIEYAAIALQKKGFSSMLIWVLKENVRARRFYEKCGFTLSGAKKEIIIGKTLIEVQYYKKI